MKRRTFIQLGISGLTVLGLGACSKNATNNANPMGMRGGNMGNMAGSTTPNTTGLITGATLYVPPLYEGELGSDGIRRYTLTATAQQHTFYANQPASTWSFSPTGQTLSYLGPTLRLRHGEQVAIKYQNQLPETITAHGHGMHVPGNADGGPHQAIAPGASWTAQYTVNQAANTAWYHPHQMGKTAEQVYKGLAGMMIVEDDNTASLDLPKTYGVDDIPLVLQDRVFTANGQQDYSPSQMEVMRGYRGDVLIANGQAEPQLSVKRGLVRLRLLNGSNAGIYRLTLNGNAGFDLIATDGSLTASPRRLQEVVISPGERVEIVVDFSQAQQGDTLTLQGYEMVSQISGIFLKMTADAEVGEVMALPQQLTTLTFPLPTEAVRTRVFRFGMKNMQFTINEKRMDMNRIDERIPLNQWEIWEVQNPMMMAHNFHIHAIHFIPLDRNGSATNLEAWERESYKDVIYMPPNSTARFMVRMEDYTTDNANPYMYHCHILEHEDNGMMGQFVTTL